MITITIKRLPNPFMTVYEVAGAELTTSEHAYRFNMRSSKLIPAGVLSLLDPNLEGVDMRTKELAEAIFSIQGVVRCGDHIGGVSISKHYLTVHRMMQSAKEDIEIAAITTIIGSLGVSREDVSVVIADIQPPATSDMFYEDESPNRDDVESNYSMM